MILTQSKEALVDKADFAKVSPYRWCAANHRHTFYAVTQDPLNRSANRNQLYMHRIILGVPNNVTTPLAAADGEPRESQTFDEDSIELISDALADTAVDTGGPVRAPSAVIR
jgi:hypothetical protein